MHTNLLHRMLFNILSNKTKADRLKDLAYNGSKKKYSYFQVNTRKLIIHTIVNVRNNTKTPLNRPKTK